MARQPHETATANSRLAVLLRISRHSSAENSGKTT
ncbi:uncharacterized protein METZ01_LOCUS364646 [marine metagenome]|uniref:Uncharacterized protein n=1 Tax=marine metagenome TaxID=408172 RepID=A0A382SQF1_9ZZZZ